MSELDAQYCEFIRERREQILERMGAAAAASGRELAAVELLAVSKTVDVPELLAGFEAGYRNFGENRPQELKRKLAALADSPVREELRFDMIGNLQTNKINQVLGRATLIHSVSSLHLAQAISKRAELRGEPARVLLEANVSGEESKSGFSPEELRCAMDELLALPGLAIEGVMTMAPARDAARAQASFSGLRELRDELIAQWGIALPVLSCGMSDDFELAIREGSTLVRLGRIVFDPGYVLG